MFHRMKMLQTICVSCITANLPAIPTHSPSSFYLLTLAQGKPHSLNTDHRNLYTLGTFQKPRTLHGSLEALSVTQGPLNKDFFLFLAWSNFSSCSRVGKPRAVLVDYAVLNVTDWSNLTCIF